MPTRQSSPDVAPVGSEPTIGKMRYPLQIGIAVVFTLLITILGATLVWYNYQGNKEMDLVAADDLFTRVTRQTATNLRRLYEPTQALVDITARLDAVESDNFAGRLALFNYFAESLRHLEHMSSVYVGYADGEFFLVRALRGDERIRELLGAPPDAHFVVQSIERTDGVARETVLYYGEDLRAVGSGRTSDTDFDPRKRIWYQKAIEVDRQIISGYYPFATTGQTGTTRARRTPNGKGVVGTDITLEEISAGIAAQRVTPSTEIVVFDETGGALAYRPDLSLEDGPGKGTGGELQQVHITDLDHPVFDHLYRQFQSDPAQDQLNLTVRGRDWVGSISELPVERIGPRLFVAMLAPHDELLAGIIELRTRSVLISLVLLAVAIAVAWWIARRISGSLRRLAVEAQSIRELKLDEPVTVRSHFLEVDELAGTMAVMKSAIQRFIEISKALSAQKDFDRLQEDILVEAQSVCSADGGSIFLFDEEKKTIEFAVALNGRTGMHYGGTGDAEVPVPIMSLVEGGEATPWVEKHVVESGDTIASDDINADARFDYRHVRERYEQGDYRCRSLLQIPLLNRQQEIIGVLELVNARDKTSGRVVGFSPEAISYVEGMSSQAAITLDNRRLLKAQKDLLDSFIQLIAGAIDAKSPYTSGHCQRVPELARMLAEAAQESDAGPFNEFSLNEDEWYELYIASWLHDCGKVTTPEYVVDKATKLECIYDRIHEIRMRFEVLWRDAQVEYYKALAEGGQDEGRLARELDERMRKISEDYAFVAECNVGGEFMDAERVERLKEIGSQIWMRNLDDRLGLSEDELARKNRTPPPGLPVQENVLADKPEHLVPREDGGDPFGDNPHGFRMDVPDNAFNFGELYNLSIAKGTLTDEERFKINEHIVQTILLLNNLPFPKELRRVPTWAGNHHEKLDGTGYPRRLSADALSVPERIMAIADIFEALTAADRPYKKAKTLSESIRIMGFMRNDGHICPELFDLFLSSGVYRAYAEQFLRPEQIDEVDISQFRAAGGRAQ